MPGNRFNGFTDYGVGIGLRIPHYRHILERKPVVAWFEIISENYMVDGGRALAILDQILEQYRVVQHGVSMYLGSAEPLSREHLKRLKALTKRTKTPWLTDHLCWGSVDGKYTHDLLPMPYTFEAAKSTAAKIREASSFLELPIAVENVSSYAEFHVSQMSEWEFLNEVVEAADCGPVIDPVWKLYEHAISRIGPTATLLEWDDRIPSFERVHAEALKDEKFGRSREAALA